MNGQNKKFSLFCSVRPYFLHTTGEFQLKGAKEWMIDENGSIIMMEIQEADASGHLDNRNGVLPSVQAPPTVQGGKNMKRVLCLYRVSTPGQVDPNNDLPRQRRACQAYIDSHDDWVFLDERLE